MITPTHDQAFSIAAGIYTLQFIEEDFVETITVVARIVWPAGLSQVDDIAVETFTNIPGNSAWFDPHATPNFSVRIGSVASVTGSEFEPVPGFASPALPGGLVFIAVDA
jgi:hypothetical protein